MSTPPEKPQFHGSLHNFALPHLKWSKNHSTNLHRGRRLGESSPQLQPPTVNAANLRSQIPVQRLSFNASSSSQSQKVWAPESATKVILRPHSDSRLEKPDMDSPASERTVESKRSELNSGFRQGMRKKAEEVVHQDEDKAMADDEDEEEEQKTWNFRPRNPLRSQVHRATTLQGSPQKQMFSLSLTREEIEEDIFAMTGSRPSRKPKRRPKAVQKHLDTIFPGVWLGSVTPDAYKVPDPSKKHCSSLMAMSKR